ncbi:hypothetical protein QJ854_gp370 [Moumouvirus goulette]|uniref:Uncharacterized protein n=1 Tax=Moumouvirus goulette TaxID=1247379 RepID=M1PXE6_9VIRU|nr:hypothetical protein QJ854_gp370 [Moumouvirus goulette]AGF85412.1 hypothetical protein glt_00603 [Moumouvirus goulette]
MHIEFNPNFGYKFLRIGYCTKDEFLDKTSAFSDLFKIYDNAFTLIPVNLSNLFYFSYDEISSSWKIFHSINNKSITNEIQNWSDSLNNLDKHFIYIFEYKETIKNICVFDKIEKKFSYSESENINYSSHNFTNLLYISHDKTILLNSDSFRDLLFSSFVHSNNFSETNDIINTLSLTKYKFFFDKTINNLQNNINNLINLPPNGVYSQIFTELKFSDTKFFNKQFVTFNSNIIKILSSSYQHDNINNVVINLISGFKYDFIIELNNLYHRFRCYPHERLFMFKHMPNHPYTLLIKKIHKYFLKNIKHFDNKINSKEIYKMFMEKFDCPRNNNFLYCIIHAVFNRSEYMSKYHEIYCTTLWSDKKPKYTFNNYFPFNIFSANLFVLEHILLLQ